MKKGKIERVIELLAENSEKPYDPGRKPSDILDVLIATKLSQNTNDKSSYKAYQNLKNKFRSWEDVSKAGLQEIRNCIKVCGLSNTKAKNIKKMLLDMKNNYGTLDISFMKKYSDEEIYEELIKYEGIGVKTISCMMIFSLGRDVFPVDTHVHRILNRLGLVKTKTAEKTFESVKDKIPEGKKYELHTNLIKFGRSICRSANPLCGVCYLRKECRFESKKKYIKATKGTSVKKNNFIILENL